MASPEELLHAKFHKLLTLGSETFHLKGKFLYCSPYDWDENVNWDVIHRLTKTVTEWILTRISTENISPGSVESSAIFAFFSCPSSWRQKSAEDPKMYAKLVIHCKMIQFLFEVDDQTEQQVGNVGHSQFVQYVRRMVTKILQYEVQTVADIRNDELYPTIVETSPHVGTCMELLLDVAQDLKTDFGVTKDLGHYFAHHFGQVFTMQTWCGDKDLSNLLNPYTQYYLRWYTGGMACGIQLIFLLEGIHVPRDVRDNVFWIRCFHIAGFLPTRVNDIIGIEREFLNERRYGLRADNVVFHFMDATNCTLEQAVFRAIVEHNLALKEFHDFWKFSKNNPEILFDLNEKNREIFAITTQIMAECISYATQGQILMSRYNSGLEFTFEKGKGIYGLESNAQFD